MPGLVTLTTDFGAGDAYAAALEGAILKVAPDVRVAHVSHAVPAGGIATGAYLVEYASHSFPEGAVHLGVVDPGVGSDRRMLAIDAGGFFLVGPDNGLLARALRGSSPRAVALEAGAGESLTFQSRDTMAPAAARLAAGAPLESLGLAATVEVEPMAPSLPDRGRLTAPVAHVDGFGTIVVDVRCNASPAPRVIRVGGREVPLRSTFGDVPSGRLVAYRGSIGYLEIAVRDGRATDELGVATGGVLDLQVVAVLKRDHGGRIHR